MRPLLQCTREELLLLVSAAGFPDVARGMGEEMIGAQSDETWEAVLLATRSQLILKQLWDMQKEMNGQSPLTEELQQFIQRYIEAKYALRATNAKQDKRLIVHFSPEDEWLCHIQINEILHEFLLVPQAQVASMFNLFYEFKLPTAKQTTSFRLNDRSFDRLSRREELSALKESLSLTNEEWLLFDQLVMDLEKADWHFDNISLLQLHAKEADDGVVIEEIQFHLPSAEGVWIVRYEPWEENVVFLQLVGEEEWAASLEQYVHEAGRFVSKQQVQG
ncbi:hypothetical protein [Shouchella hunanensis]|uniref:Uncharacterized protein n=1 Tax=Shouchella hunanensis TaxID=766894 RepID=A0ABY7W8D3_9BACI|nr:hypothetical protein [Shouchella hunanensis]WDF05197.1 hypothetical protein PQ477_06940 [Shouchella hunanensis]